MNGKILTLRINLLLEAIWNLREHVSNTIIIVYHDESIFNANDDTRRLWKGLWNPKHQIQRQRSRFHGRFWVKDQNSDILSTLLPKKWIFKKFFEIGFQCHLSNFSSSGPFHWVIEVEVGELRLWGLIGTPSPCLKLCWKLLDGFILPILVEWLDFIEISGWEEGIFGKKAMGINRNI